MHKLQKKHLMMQQYIHGNRQVSLRIMRIIFVIKGEILETSESKKDFRDLKRMLGLSNIHH